MSVFAGITYRHWKDVPEDHPPCVYYLADPRTPNTPLYIGMSGKLRERLKGHHKASPHRTDAHATWIKALAADGVFPVLRVMRVCGTVSEAIRLEWRIVARLKRRGVHVVGQHVVPPVDLTRWWASCGSEVARELLRAELAAA